MIIENALRIHLLAALTALLGNKIYYVTAPQDVETPYVVFFKVSEVRSVTLTGTGDTVNARIQFSIFADTYYETKQTAEQIKLALHGKCQETIGGAGGLSVSCQYEDETDLYESDSLTFHCAADYFIQFNE